MNGYPNIETPSDYEEYKRAVGRFFERESITNLSAETGDDCDHACIICNEIVGFEPFFSWRACDCCGRALGGDRYHATGWSPQDKAAYCYDVCTDCIYFAEYGRLDDLTMLLICDGEIWSKI